MDLGGTWAATLADEDLRRAYPAVDFDDDAWQRVPVPGHWRSTPAFAASDGPLLLRRPFSTPPVADRAGGTRTWLTFDGIFYSADVWLDGSYVGDTEGYFAPHTFEVTEAVARQQDHVLAVEVACAPQRDRTAKRNLTGVFQHWDCLDPDWNPGGIWRPVSLRDTGAIALRTLRVLCLEATADRAVLAFTATVDASDAADATLRTRIGLATEAVEEQRLAAGANRVEWRVAVEAPPLWWPHALGSPDLVDVTVAVETADGESDRRTLRTGIRQVRMSDFVVSVNGERLFVKGTNLGPTRMALADATPDEIERDVALAKQAGLDLVRVHAHVSRPELYDAADRHGMLVWQDLPLQWGYARGVRKQAAKQAVAAVDLLGHHPSIAIWCGHNEPFALDIEPGGDIDLARLAVRGAAAVALPTWNKTVLDGSVHRAFEKADRSRPVVANAGVLGRTSSHLYFGWYHGHERDLPRFAAAWPRAVRFVGEFGAQAVPNSDAFLDPGAWPQLDWDRLGRTHALQRRFFERNGLDPDRFPTFEGWRDATQAYQATVVKHHVETLRRLKYRPCGGFTHFLLADGHPSVTWSVLDDARVAKRAYDALAAACAPVIVVADRPDASYAPGAPIHLDVHVVSDLREPIEGATVTALLTWDGGDASWSWTGDVPADSCVIVGAVDTAAPDTTGRLTLDLVVDARGTKTTNRYESAVVAPL